MKKWLGLALLSVLLCTGCSMESASGESVAAASEEDYYETGGEYAPAMKQVDNGTDEFTYVDEEVGVEENQVNEEAGSYTDESGSNAVEVANVEGKINPIKVIELGTAQAQYDYIAAMYIEGNIIYVKDGDRILTIDEANNDKQSTYFDLHNLALPANLNNPESIRSINVSQMEKINGELIVSGFIFESLEGQGLTTKHGKEIVGNTYTMVFGVKNGKSRIIHLSLSRINEAYEKGSFFETDEGLPTDLFQWEGDTTLYAYWLYTEKPRFTYSNGKIYFPRHWNRGLAVNADGTADSSVDILSVDLNTGKEEILYKDYDVSVDYRFPVKEGDTLKIYRGTSIVYYNLITKEERVDAMPPEFVIKRPIYRDGSVYALTDEGIWSVDYNNGGYDFSWNIIAEETSISAFIPAYDVKSNGHIYVADFQRRVIYVF